MLKLHGKKAISDQSKLALISKFNLESRSLIGIGKLFGHRKNKFNLFWPTAYSP